MPKLLSDAQIQAYRQGGYLCPVEVLSPAEAAQYRAKLERAEAAACPRLALAKGETERQDRRRRLEDALALGRPSPRIRAAPFACTASPQI